MKKHLKTPKKTSLMEERKSKARIREKSLKRDLEIVLSTVLINFRINPSNFLLLSNRN